MRETFVKIQNAMTIPWLFHEFSFPMTFLGLDFIVYHFLWFPMFNSRHSHWNILNIKIYYVVIIANKWFVNFKIKIINIGKPVYGRECTASHSSDISRNCYCSVYYFNSMFMLCLILLFIVCNPLKPECTIKMSFATSSKFLVDDDGWEKNICQNTLVLSCGQLSQPSVIRNDDVVPTLTQHLFYVTW